MPDSADGRLLAIAGRQHSAFTRRQAIQVGFTSRMIQGRLDLRLWLPVHRGVYITSGSRRTWRQALMAACLATDGIAAGRSAGALYGLTPEGELEVLVSRSSRRRRPGVTVLQSDDVRRGDRVTVEGIPATSVARTIIDLARFLDNDPLEVVVDRAVTRRLVTINCGAWVIGLGRVWARTKVWIGHGRRDPGVGS